MHARVPTESIISWQNRYLMLLEDVKEQCAAAHGYSGHTNALAHKKIALLQVFPGTQTFASSRTL